MQHGCNGAGTTVAVEIDSPVQQSDVNAYLAAAGVQEIGQITNVPVDGGGPANNGKDTNDAALAVETIAGLAPGANILVYESPDLSDQSIIDDYNQTVSDNVAKVVNSSFGQCDQDPVFDADTNAIAEQGAAKGITFVSSSGDNGSDECYTGNMPSTPLSPASLQYFVAVGGLNFTENSSGILTSLTATGNPSVGFLSGGGVSPLNPLPAYQNGIPNVIASGRNVPDVSLPGVNVSLYINGPTVSNGTSWSSPEFVALLAEAIELQDAPGFGYVNPAIYALFTSQGYADFTDVTVGNNGAYSASTGYDLVTGIGAPKGYLFASSI